MRLARVPITVIASLLAAVTLVMFAPAASAGTKSISYTGGCIIRLSEVTAAPGAQLTVTATGYPAAAVVTFSITTGGPGTATITIGTVTADASGTAVLVFSLPADTTPGMHVITATGVPAGQCEPSVSTNLMVSAQVVNTTTSLAGTGGGGTLPRTGTNSAELFQIALLLIAAGGLITLATRKRLSRAHVES